MTDLIMKNLVNNGKIKMEIKKIYSINYEQH